MPVGVVGAGPLGVEGAGPLGVVGAGPLGVVGAGPLGVEGAGPLGVVGAGPLGAVGAGHLGVVGALLLGSYAKNVKISGRSAHMSAYFSIAPQIVRMIRICWHMLAYFRIFEIGSPIDIRNRI